jgi:hypothetical protein
MIHIMSFTLDEKCSPGCTTFLSFELIHFLIKLNIYVINVDLKIKNQILIRPSIAIDD